MCLASRRDAHGHFTKNKWLVIADDDSYIFHHNMLSYLSTLESSRVSASSLRQRAKRSPSDPRAPPCGGRGVSDGS